MIISAPQPIEIISMDAYLVCIFLRLLFPAKQTNVNDLVEANLLH